MINTVKNTYRALPLSVKNIYRAFRDISIVKKLRGHPLVHNWIYDSNYYEIEVEGPAIRSAGTISSSIINDFNPTRIVDVGCGTGAMLEALRDRGCEVFGFEYSDAALKYCKSRQLNVKKFDLERDVFDDNRTFDVAVSVEVAEHLPEKIADRYVDILTRLSPVIVFTAAPPGQGGADHVNEQPPSYWISKFQQRDFNYAEEQSLRWREQWKASGEVEYWYYQNLMIFQSIQQI